MAEFNARNLRQVADSTNKANEEVEAAQRRANELEAERKMHRLGPERVRIVYEQIKKQCQEKAAKGEYRISYTFRVRSDSMYSAFSEEDYADRPLLTSEGQSTHTKLGDAEPFTVYGQKLIALLARDGLNVRFSEGYCTYGLGVIIHLPYIDVTWR
jgi:hypothetical protein